MPLLLSVLIYGGTFMGYVTYDNIISPYEQKILIEDTKNFPIDPIGEKVEKENEQAFNNLKGE